MRRLTAITAILATSLLIAGRSSAAQNADAVTFFESRIRPVLADNCFVCHGPVAPRGGIRLDSRAALLSSPGGPIVIPGQPQNSRLIRAILYNGPIKMPPAGKLGPNQIRDLTSWVQQGSPWPADTRSAGTGASPAADPAASHFWSFQPVKEPTLPPVKQKAWPQSPIDHFILSKLEKAGLQPAPRADRRTLLRRATFDLTGLPPTMSEMRDFLADRSPGAFAHVVDRLLASPQYGERWGRHWLDVVRYCDSLDARGLGGEGDISEAWRYRDWVVDAFNNDLPYDQFIINQIAGDLLPTPPQPPIPPAATNRLAGYRTGANPVAAAPSVLPYLRGAGRVNARGIIATGMLAIGNWGNGDADKEKILTDIADDQVDVVCRGFMGLTVACARCHDHKFDPIPTRDYYGLAGIFFSTHILPGLAPKGSGETPLRVPLLSPAESEQRRQASDHAVELEKLIQSRRDQYARYRVLSLLPRTSDYLTGAWEIQHSGSLSLPDYAARHGLQEDALRSWVDHLFDSGYRLMTTPVRDLLGNTGVHVWKGESDTPSVTVNTNDTPRTILTFTLPPRSVSVHPGPTNGVVVGWRSPITGTIHLIGGVADADPACGDGIAWIIDRRDRAGYHELASGEFPNGGDQTFNQGKGAANLVAIPVKSGEMIQLLVLPKASYACDTTVVHLTITEMGTGRKWDLTIDALDTFHEGGNPHPDSYKNPAVWSFSDMADSSRARTAPGPQSAARDKWLKAAALAHTREELRKASDEFAQTFNADDTTNPFWTTDPQSLSTERRLELAGLQSELDTLKKALSNPIGYANAAQEGGVPGSPQAGFHDVRIHIRGSYARLGDIAPRHFPVVLAGDSQPAIKHGSGRLELARWIASPTHPLTARVIVNRLWQYHFGEGIVRTPGNFGKLGERPTHPELLDYLASQFVKNGWSIKKLNRMMMLSATYQQSSLASPAALRDDPDNRLFGRMNRQRLDAESLRDTLLAVTGRLDFTVGGPAVRDLETSRRTLYLMTIRSDRSGYRSLFDAADPTAMVDRRTVSTVAPQALFLLNSDFARESARALSRRLLQEIGRDDVGRIHRAYQLLYGRQALPGDLAVGRAYLDRARGHRAAETPAAADDRAWSAYSQILLCANELMYID